MEREDLAELLPDDVLANVLSRLAPRGLAASRCVCTAWRALIDGRRLLRADFLPRSLAGLFINFSDLPFAELFSRPSMESTSINYCLPYEEMEDHCNGLLLLGNATVLNPATGRRAPLPVHPPPPIGMEYFAPAMFLVHDPTVSAQYEVFSIPRVPDKDESDDEYDGNRTIVLPNRKVRRVDKALLGSEWPQSPWILNVFSSTTGRWEKRYFSREGEAAGTIADMQLDSRWKPQRRSAYWQGALYVHCENDFVMRILVSNNMYHMVKPPRGICKHRELHLGRSEQGVYFALLRDDKLVVWILEESCGELEWTLKHDSGRGLLLASLNCVRQGHGPWILHDLNSRQLMGDKDEEQLAVKHASFEWNSDDDNILNIADHSQDSYGYIKILGFHPYKEIIFLHRSMNRGLAYHLNSSKLEDLGNLCPKVNFLNHHSCITSSFPYTPCYVGELSE